MILRPKLTAITFGFAIVAGLALLRWYDPVVLKELRDNAFDYCQRLAPRPYENTPVRIVDIDETSLRELGQWPWPRTLVAKLLSRLEELGASVVAFDILFSEPDRMSPRSVMTQAGQVDPAVLAGLPDNDAILANQIANRPVVLGFAATVGTQGKPPVKAGFAFTGESPIHAPPRLSGAATPLPLLSDAAAGIGDISMNPEQRNAVVRTIPLFLSDGTQLYPSLAMEALRVAQGASTYILANAPERPASIGEVRVGEYVVPTTAAGELWLYLSPEDSQRYVSARDVLSGSSEAFTPLIEGSIVFVGTSSAGLLDIRATALGENVPGVSLHAQAVEQILTGHYLSRPDWADGLEIFSTFVLGLIVVLLITFVTPWVAVTVGAIVSAATILVSWNAFQQQGLLLDWTFPVATSLATQFAAICFRFLVTDQERRHIRRAFSQNVSPSVLARAESHPEALRLGGVDRDITMMFMDVRDFTTLSEGMAPTELVSLINKLLSGLSSHVIETEGTLDKFIGDSIMAFWNAPVDVANHPAKAARCALAMRRTLREMNERNAFGLGKPIAFGVGINSGVACVGNMGAESRFNYSAVGDAVNASARIESMTKEVAFDIVVSEATAKEIPDFALLDAGFHALKGKTRQIRLFLLVGDEALAKTPEFRTLQSSHAQLLAALAGARTRKAATLCNEAIDMAHSVMPDLERFYRRLAGPKSTHH